MQYFIQISKTNKSSTKNQPLSVVEYKVVYWKQG